VHDSSTARLWWEKERGGAEFAAQNKAPKDVAENAASGVYSAKDAAWFLGEAASSGSGVFICPIQDYLALTDAWRSEDAEAERINVPGTVNGFNWTWRLPATIETLAKDKDLVEAISLAAKKHGN
jgi:4-alpha-glucanotransferase